MENVGPATMQNKKTKTDGAELLSRLSGISRDEVLALWQQVKDNKAKLKSCARHRVDVDPASVNIGMRLRCVSCGGEMSLSDIGSYIGGYVSNGGSADDIWPGYK